MRGKGADEQCLLAVKSSDEVREFNHGGDAKFDVRKVT